MAINIIVVYPVYVDYLDKEWDQVQTGSKALKRRVLYYKPMNRLYTCLVWYMVVYTWY